MSVNAREEKYESIELFEKPALFTNSRIDRDTVPEGFHCYDLRGSDNDPGRPVTVETSVGVNHAGTVLTTTPVKPQKDKDAELGCVGHLRLDFGRGGQEFHHTWWAHNDDRLNTPAFKAELEVFMDEMRKHGPLQDLREMQSYCYTHGGVVEESRTTATLPNRSSTATVCVAPPRRVITMDTSIFTTSANRNCICRKPSPNRA